MSTPVLLFAVQIDMAGHDAILIHPLLPLAAIPFYQLRLLKGTNGAVVAIVRQMHQQIHWILHPTRLNQGWKELERQESKRKPYQV